MIGEDKLAETSIGELVEEAKRLVATDPCYWNHPVFREIWYRRDVLGDIAARAKSEPLALEPLDLIFPVSEEVM
jgi:hypothetical protein